MRAGSAVSPRQSTAVHLAVADGALEAVVLGEGVDAAHGRADDAALVLGIESSDAQVCHRWGGDDDVRQCVEVE